MRQYDFYIVPTPIGNLDDITRRAIDILKSVDVIACEDVRVTQKLLVHLGIAKKCISYHKFNEKERLNYFITQLEQGKRIALVSDAGTPLFCDPGAVIVKELRRRDFSVTALAGANAVATFLSQLAREGEDFFFVGFMPRIKSQVEGILRQYRETDIVFYESPNRLIKTLDIIKNCRFGVRVAIGRELTKVFEEIVVDDIEKVIDYFKNNILKGEIVVLVFRDDYVDCDIDIDSKISILQKRGYGAKDISTILASLYEINKNYIYKRINMRKPL